MKRYAIWDKQSPVIVPTGKVFTAEEWKEKYPVAALESITVVCAAGEVNGGFFGTLGQMVQMYTAQGADFSTCTTDEEYTKLMARLHPAEQETAADGDTV